MADVTNAKIYDVVLVGGGIMSATLASLITRLEPRWTVKIVERLDDVAQESSNPWNNAGTGHSALCELNYTPEHDGVVDVSKALRISERFQLSREFWASLVADGSLPDPTRFIHRVPHMTLVRGDDDVAFLRRRTEALRAQPLFDTIEFSDDPATIYQWAPLLVLGREKSESIAATRVAQGTDVDFGALTRELLQNAVDRGALLRLGTEVVDLRQEPDSTWSLATRVRSGANLGRRNVTRARFVFVGAGGGALPLLQRAGIPEIRGFGGFPISGEFLRCDNPAVVAQHNAKVYGKAAVGAPPMSVPHLDTRVVDGRRSLLFGPYAGFNTRYLKAGSLLDFFSTVRPGNIPVYAGAGVKNLDLVEYLAGQLLASKEHKFAELVDFYPDAAPDDWRLITAGQRVQIMKRDASGRAILQMGTEIVSHADGSIAGLLGASPGASTSVSAMLEVLERCFPERYARQWAGALHDLIPTLGHDLGERPDLAHATLGRTAKALGVAA